MRKEKIILDAQDFKRVLNRISHQIIEKHKGVKDLAFVGIQTRGDYLAKRLASQVGQIENIIFPVGSMDINMYRDDWTIISYQPIVRPSHIPFPVDKKKIILVDDVLFTGRTVRAAMDALMDFGRPSRIELAILVERGGYRELPIQADYRGVFVNTEHQEIVNVNVTEHDGQDLAFIE